MIKPIPCCNRLPGNVSCDWQLCNGSNGTPDLRGQFVVGAGGSYTPGDTGGASSVTLSANTMPIHTHELTGSLTTGSAGSHTHTTSVTDPGHFHTLPYVAGLSASQGGTGVNKIGGTEATTTVFTGISVTIASAIDHVHSLTLSGNTQSAGGTGGTTQPHENRPPYYALCYIQKMY